MDDLLTVIRDLYDREINAGLQSFFDAGVTVYLGDELNGRQVEQTFALEELSLIPAWLRAEAARLFPSSS